MSRPITDDVFRAVAHPVRRQILDMLRKRELTPGEIVESIPMTGATVSGHLKALRTVGLVTQRSVGVNRVYSLNRRAMRTMKQWVARF